MNEEEKNSISVEEHLKLLGDIVSRLESEELSLEESLRVFSEGVTHVKEAQTLLSQAEEKLKVLTEDGEIHDF